jgi:hypothetical protein
MIKRCQVSDEFQSELGRLLQLVARQAIDDKFPGHPEADEMVAEAVLVLCRIWTNFNPHKSDEPYSYFWLSAYSAGIGYLNKIRKEQQIKELLS